MHSDETDAAEPGNASQGSKASAARLLSRAHTHRLRAEWDEAIACCHQAIALDPADPSAHVLLGDVHAARHDNEQAIACYRAALELADDSVVRLKIEELREKEKLPQPAKPRQRWPQQWSFPGRRARRRWAAMAALAGSLLILALIFVAMWAQGRGATATGPSGALAAERPGAAQARPMAVSPEQPAIPLSAPTYRPTPPPAPAATHAPTAPYRQPGASRPASRGGARVTAGHTRQVERSAQLKGPLTDREKRIVYELSQLGLRDGNPIGTYVTAALSPRSESLVITFEVPDEVAAHPSGKFVLAEANRLAMTAAEVDTGFKTCMVRVLIGYTDRRTGSRHTVCIFEAETTRALLAEASPPARGQPSNVFPQPWWNERYWGSSNAAAERTGPP